MIEGLLGGLLGGKVSTKMVQLFWGQLCEQMKEAGCSMIEDPDALVAFLRVTADKIESRKELFGERKSEESVD